MTAALAELHFHWGGETIHFTLEPSERRRLKITVTPLGEIHVLAPKDAANEAIVARVARRGSWIVRQLRDFARWRPRTPLRNMRAAKRICTSADSIVSLCRPASCRTFASAAVA